MLPLELVQAAGVVALGAQVGGPQQQQGACQAGLLPIACAASLWGQTGKWSAVACCQAGDGDMFNCGRGVQPLSATVLVWKLPTMLLHHVLGCL